MTSRSDRTPESLLGNQELVVPIAGEIDSGAVHSTCRNGDVVHENAPSMNDTDMSHAVEEAGRTRLRMETIGKKSRQKILRKLQTSLVWGLSKEKSQRAVARFSDRDRRLQVTPQGTSVEDGLWAIAIAQRLPKLRLQLPVEEWAHLVKSLCQMAEEAQQSSVHVDPWMATLVCVELGMTLGLGCPEHAECREAAANSGQAAFEILSHSCSKDGTPRHLPDSHSVPFFAAWIRALILFRELYGEPPRELRHPFELLARHLLRQTRPDRTLVFSDQVRPIERKEWRALWDMAGRLIHDPVDRRLIQHVVAKKGQATARIRSLASHCDETAGLARLSQGWGKRSASLFVDFREPNVAIELNARGRLLLSGCYQTNISWNGVRLEPTGTWTLQCWYSEPEADYLEVEWQLTHGCRLQRQFLLAKDDEFVFLGDAVLPAGRGLMDYRVDWPTHPEITFHSHDESNEGSLRAGDKPLAHVIPLALPEWRSYRSVGNLRQESKHACMELHSEGAALYAPILFHFRKKELDRQPTWRQLTVAESLQRVDRDVAVGYRYQCGLNQWLFYKSLTKFGNRTVLGQNYSLDFACSRFLHSGLTKSIVDVEIDADNDGTEPFAVGSQPAECPKANPSSGNAGWT
jgi:hypothetical protein